MQYPRVHTKVFILGGSEIGEASRYFHLLTQDCGLVTSLAQGVRSLSSKRRGHLNIYSLADAVLVRGHLFWRLASASEEVSTAYLLRERSDLLSVLARLSSLVLRLVRGEEHNAVLFHVLENTVQFIAHEKPSINQARECELIAVVRILACLGYISEKDRLQTFLKTTTFEPELISLARRERHSLATEINHAIKASQL